MPVVSPIYNVLKTLVANNFAILNYKVKDIQQDIRNYFLIELDSPSLESIIQDYNLIDTHFSIDELYNPGINSGYGYTPMHYTEVYFSEEENKYIVLHGYLNAKGEYQYCQVKELNESKEFTGIYKTLSNEQKEMLKEKIKHFKLFTDAVLAEHQRLAQDTKYKADQLDLELTKLSRDLNESNIRAKYLKVANLFSQAVKEFNQYSFVKDVRDKLVLRMFKNMEIIHRCIESTKPKPMILEIPESEEKEKPEDAGILPKLASLNDLYVITLNNIKIIIKNIESIQSIIEANLILLNQYAEQAHEQILIFYTFPNVLSKQDFLYIQEINLKLNEHYTQYLKLLSSNVLKGDLDEVKKLYPLLKNQITDEFYSRIIYTLINNPLNKDMIAALDACDYLNEMDINYRSFILKISEKNKYPVSKKIERVSNTMHIEKYDASLLFNVYLENNLPLFIALLRHGASANTWGMSLKKGSVGYANLFSFITTFREVNSKNYLDFLKTLLLYKVDPNEVYTQSMSTDLMQHKLKISKLNLKSKNKKNSEIAGTSTKLGKFNTVETLINIPGFEGFNLVLDTASPISLAYCLVLLSGVSLLEKHILNTSSSYGIYCANTFEQAYDEVERDLCKKLSGVIEMPSGSLLFHVCFSSSKNNTQANVMAKEFLKKIEILDQRLTCKTNELGIAEFNKQYEELFNYAEEEVYRNKWIYAYCSFVGCEFLLMKKAFCLFSTPKEIRTFIKGYIRPLYDNIIMLVPKVFTDVEQIESLVASYRKSQASFLQIDIDTESKKGTEKVVKKHIVPTANQDKILAFCEAARDGQLKKLKILLKETPILLDASFKGWTPLHYACKQNQIECAKELIASGASIEIPNDKGKCALDLVKDKSKKESLLAFKKAL